MKSVGIFNRKTGRHAAVADLGEEQLAAIEQAQAEPSPSPGNDHSVIVDVPTGLGRTPAFHPDFDGKILKLQIGRNSKIHTTPGSLKAEGLPNFTEGIGRGASEAASV